MDLLGLGYYSIFSLLGWIFPLLVIYVIYRIVTRHSATHQKARKELTTRDGVLASIVISAGYAGLMGIYYLPIAIFGESADTAAFATRLVVGVGLLVIGLIIRQFTGNFLMGVGVLSIIFAAPYVFSNLGSVGALLVVFLAFVALVAAAVVMSKKGSANG